MDRFTEEQMIHLIAYQNLYGPLTPQRLDVLFARLGMDVAAPHMKKGKRPQLKDHIVEWSRSARPRKTGRQMLEWIKGIQRGYDRDTEGKEG